jgi:hypothetical protein
MVDQNPTKKGCLENIFESILSHLTFLTNSFSLLPYIVGGGWFRFSPERFLDSSGRVIKKEHFVPFGVGNHFTL